MLPLGIELPEEILLKGTDLYVFDDLQDLLSYLHSTVFGLEQLVVSFGCYFTEHQSKEHEYKHDCHAY